MGGRAQPLPPKCIAACWLLVVGWLLLHLGLRIGCWLLAVVVGVVVVGVVVVVVAPWVFVLFLDGVWP